MFGALRLGLAIAKRLSKAEDRDALIETLTKAVGDDGKVSPIEWSGIGRKLGVFDVAK